MSRELRQLVPIEVACVLAIAMLPMPAGIPVALPLLLCGTASRWPRGRPWEEVSKGSSLHAGIGVLAGAIALAIALVLGNQSLIVLYESAGDQILQIVDLAGATGQAMHVVLAVVAVAIVALATELALRGWLVERVLELSPGSPVLPVLCGAFVEALVMPGDPPVRIAGAVFGAGLGWLYVAGGRSVVAPACARAVFQGGAVVLEAFRLV